MERVLNGSHRTAGVVVWHSETGPPSVSFIKNDTDGPLKEPYKYDANKLQFIGQTKN